MTTAPSSFQQFRDDSGLMLREIRVATQALTTMRHSFAAFPIVQGENGDAGKCCSDMQAFDFYGQLHEMEYGLTQLGAASRALWRNIPAPITTVDAGTQVVEEDPNAPRRSPRLHALNKR
jgi:hypothetical protein